MSSSIIHEIEDASLPFHGVLATGPSDEVPGTVTLRNVTVHGPSGGEAGAEHGVHLGVFGSATVRDSIVRGDFESVVCGIDLSTSDIQGLSTRQASCADAGGNVDLDPLWVNAAAGDYRLLANSPLIDLGSDDPLQVDESILDFGGDSRILDGDGVSPLRRDMGADEYLRPASGGNPQGGQPAGGQQSTGGGNTSPAPAVIGRLRGRSRFKPRGPYGPFTLNVGQAGSTIQATVSANSRLLRSAAVKTVASLRRKRVGPGRVRFTLRPKRKLRRALRRVRRGRFTLRVVITPPAGRRVTLKRKLSIRR